jgi:hypothetical protein
VKELEKDVLLICKGRFNSNKYFSIIHALKEYQARECGIEVSEITDIDVFLFSLLPTMQSFFEVGNYESILSDRISYHINS